MHQEQDFLEGLKNKSEAAYRSLVEDYSERLYRVISRFLRNAEEAREVLQVVFLRVIENIERFEGNSSIYTWLYRIAVNESLMKLRSQKGKESVSLEEARFEYEDGIRTDVVPDWTKLPDEKMEEREVQEFLQNCLQDLPEELRAAYVLKDREQLSEDEVCDVLHITKPTMKNRVHRARLILRQRLENKYVR